MRDTFQAIFAGLNPEDLRKSLQLPVFLKLWQAQVLYLQGCNGPNKLATYNRAEVEKWEDGKTPSVIQRTFEDVSEEDMDGPGDEDHTGTKYRGPVDSTAGAQEHGEHKEDIPWAFLCPDASDQNLSGPALIQVAGAKLQSMGKTAEAMKQEMELAEVLDDKVNRRHLLNRGAEFQKLLAKMTGDSFLNDLEKALQAECATSASFQQKEEPTLVVPTRRKYANMWEPQFWQECFPTCWVHGDCLYADPKRNEPPYKQMNYNQFSKMILLMEELEYDNYDGENYQAECYGANHWHHRPDVEELLRRHEQAKNKERREPVQDPQCFFRVNRFRKLRIVLFVLSTFWRLLSGFTAVNVGLRIPGMQARLRDLATVPVKLVMTAAEAGSTDGAMDLVRSARHLFDIIQGKVVGSDGYRISCRHRFSAYTIFCGPPLVFCTPNLADNRNFIILLTQGEPVNLDLDADMELQISYEQLRLRVANDPVGQTIVVELLLRLFVLHILGARPECVAQPQGRHDPPREWLSDGVAASLTSLGCLVILMAARGELEASGRGSLHGHWQIWPVARTMFAAIHAFETLEPMQRVQQLRAVVVQWINFFQRTHHSSVRHLPLLYGGTELAEELPMTKSMMKNCRMDGQKENFEGFCTPTRPLCTEADLGALPPRLPRDCLYEPPEDPHADPQQVPVEVKKKTLCGQSISSFPQYNPAAKTFRRPSILLSVHTYQLRRASANHTTEIDECWPSPLGCGSSTRWTSIVPLRVRLGRCTEKCIRRPRDSHQRFLPSPLGCGSSGRWYAVALLRTFPLLGITTRLRSMSAGPARSGAVRARIGLKSWCCVLVKTSQLKNEYVNRATEINDCLPSPLGCGGSIRWTSVA